MTRPPHSLPADATLVVMGVSGCGKTTVAGLLARRLDRPLLEGDDEHSAQAKRNMASGRPLDDDDRWPWLRRIRAWITAQAAAGSPGIVACSALTRSYRDLLGDGPAPVVFVHLHVGRAELHRRLSERTGHYMKADMLDSQLAALEPPGGSEGNAVTIEATGSPGAVADAVLRRLVRP